MKQDNDIYEAPHRLLKTLKELSEVLGGSRAVTICKELTKRYENSMVTTLAEACSYYENNQPRGEYVLVIAGKDRNELKEEAQAQWLTMSEQEHVDMYIAQGLDKKRGYESSSQRQGVYLRGIYIISFLEIKFLKEKCYTNVKNLYKRVVKKRVLAKINFKE